MDADERVRPSWAFATAVSEDLLAGAQLLRRAFLAAPAFSARRGAVVIPADTGDPPSLLITEGVAYRSITLPDGQRAIADIILPTDIVGLHHAVMGHSSHDVVAASQFSYRLLKAAQMQELMGDHRIAMRALALTAEERWRADRHLAAITRLGARGRIAWMLIDIFERLRLQNLIFRPIFSLSLTQDQIADYLGITKVHVNRTFRRMREERLVLVDRHVVIILDLDALRRVASGLPSHVSAIAQSALQTPNSRSSSRSWRVDRSSSGRTA